MYTVSSAQLTRDTCNENTLPHKQSPPDPSATVGSLAAVYGDRYGRRNTHARQTQSHTITYTLSPDKINSSET